MEDDIPWIVLAGESFPADTSCGGHSKTKEKIVVVASCSMLPTIVLVCHFRGDSLQYADNNLCPDES